MARRNRPLIRMEALECRRMMSVTLVSAGVGGGAGTPSTGTLGVASRALAASENGRYVVFVSDAANLVAGDTNNVADVFVRDLQTGVTTLVSATPGGAVGNAASGQAAGDDVRGATISRNGRFVAFVSRASDLVANDTNGSGADVFVRDLQSGVTTLATINAAGTASGTDASTVFVYGRPELSDDGRYLAFSSTAVDLVAGQENDDGAADTFLRDLQAGTTVQLTRALGSAGTAQDSVFQSISGDGRFVAFASSDPITAQVNDGSELSQVYVYDTSTGVSQLASLSADGVSAGNGDSLFPRISRDGRHLAFLSAADNIVTGMQRAGGSGDFDVMHRDLATGVNQLASRAAAGATQGGNGGSDGVAISGDGRHIVFYSRASNLAAFADDNNTSDAFLFDTSSGVVTTLSESVVGGAVALLGAGNTPGSGAAPTISDNGRYVVFGGLSTDIDPGDSTSNVVSGLFRVDTQTGVTRRLLLSQLLPDQTPVLSNTAHALATDDGAVFFAADGFGLPGHESASLGFQIYVDGTSFSGGGNNGGGSAGPIDLVPTVTATLPASAIGGERARASVNVRVTNAGSGALNGPVTVTVYLSADATLDSGDPALATVSRKLKLRAGRAATLKFKVSAFPVVAAGSYQVIAEVTGGAGVTESNTANNRAAASGQVAIATPFVDLSTVAPADTKPARAGRRTTLLLDVTNAGNVLAAGTVVVRVNLTPAGGGVTTSVDVPLRLKHKPGVTRRYKLKLTLPGELAAGVYSATVDFDATAVIAESDEANNAAGPVNVTVV